MGSERVEYLSNLVAEEDRDRPCCSIDLPSKRRGHGAFDCLARGPAHFLA